MKSLLCAGILFSSLYLAINLFGHTSAARIPYNSTGDDSDHDSYAPPQKKIYGTVFNKKCNCTKVVKQALANAYGNEEDEGREESYAAPKYANKKPMEEPQYEEEEEEYSAPKSYKPQRPKKMSKPSNSSYGQQEEYQEEEEEETYSKPRPKPTYGKKPKPRPVKVVKVKVEESYDEEENEYEAKPSYGKKNSTSYKKPKQRADYADSVSMDELLGEDDEEEYQLKKKPAYAKPKPKYTKPKYEEAQEEEEDDGYDMRDEMTYKKPQRKPTKRVKPAAYEEEAEDQYEEPTYKPAPRRKPVYSKPEKNDYEDLSSYGQKEQYEKKTNYTAPKQTEPEYAAPEKPSGSPHASKPAEKPSSSEYGEEKKHSHKPAESEYAESKPDYDIKPVNGSYGKEEPKHHHTTPKHHHETPDYSEPAAPKYEERKEGGYESSGQTAVIPPKIITVHQNASRETGILIKLVDHKKAPAAEYKNSK